ncbi:MAG: DUF2783 domain-containing protein [Gammaproteobacteria bacterium]
MTASLNIEPNIENPDDFYEALIETHQDLTPQQSQLANAKLILLLSNHIGDLDILRDAMKRARSGVKEDTGAVADTESQPTVSGQEPASARTA